MAPESLTTGAIIENLDTVISFTEDHADLFNLPAKKKFGLLVAVEEAFVNICHYAYPGKYGDVTVFISVDTDTFVVQLADLGEPCDVLSLPEPDLTADIMERRIGGLGVFFIRKLTNNVTYRRENGQNILQMVLNRNE